MGHGLHALMIYHQRVYQDAPLPEVPLAGSPAKVRVAATFSSALNPPEPECEQRADSMSLRRMAEESDNCVEQSQLHEAIREALRDTSPAEHPITAPVQ